MSTANTHAHIHTGLKLNNNNNNNIVESPVDAHEPRGLKRLASSLGFTSLSKKT